ncbi:hypothetical protein NQ318_016416 [Aromia moschata]|uniref:Uncharacterized protein n=1 Tax=Aromia moschata TaxID=1265417 RepID=A0AAV8Z5B6_9CUCU|nr:hypothetical protein NQ318_016416 [Aromia moschata]
MSSPTENRPPKTPRREDGSETPGREEIPETPTARTPRRGARTPRREVSPAKSTSSSRTPRKALVTPAKSVSSSTVDTPMRWGRRDLDGAQSESEVPPSPAHSLAPTSPGIGLMSDMDVTSPLNYGTPSSLGSIRTPRSGIRGTPIRMRPDVRSDKRIRQVNVGNDPGMEAIPESQESEPIASQMVIWGTNVSIAECKEKFKQFILRFIDPNAEEDERTDDMNINEPLYLQKLEEGWLMMPRAAGG